MEQQSRINSVGRRTASKTVNGTSWTKIIDSVEPANGRNGVRITNNDASVVLALTYVKRDAAAPAVASTPVATMAEDYVGAKQTLTILLGPGIDVYGANDTGASTTSNVTLREIA